ncbi:hypothetical protein BaOVIS_021590 [Babesia ovis]|uniref:Uncharacterized protein n=1 Tax=Babesia ovis TaxID=5869 RepID=A0A9W5TC42_BABOV|nr:hypothetical protein BaOVIS_021590 [Babesia ovis]
MITREYASTTDTLPLVKPAPVTRSDWEKQRRKDEESSTSLDKIDPDTWRGMMRNQKGFGRPYTHKTKIGTNFISRLQNVTDSTPRDEVIQLLTEITCHINELNEYELVDIGYYLTRVNRPECSTVVEPMLHRFFSLPERHSCLNGVYIHRLLRTMFIYQDVTYRVWVYEIAQIVGIKHRHLLMRDLQLVIDDLSLFYDAAAQSALNKFEDIIIKRAHELEISRLPLVIHALGRSGYNTIEVAKVIHRVYLQKRGHPDFYKCHLIGLLLKGYTNFRFHPGRAFLDEAWEHMKEGIKTAEFKYISWLGESFLRLRYVEHAPRVLDELLNKVQLLSHLEYTDFISGCWSIQSHILSQEFQRYIVPGSEWQLTDQNDISTIPGNTHQLYVYYKKLLRAVMSNLTTKIYESTPPYRATQFELLTRLLVIYPNPRDFREILPLRKFDPVYPKVNFNGDIPKLGTIDYLFQEHTHLQASRFFGDGHTLDTILNDTGEVDSVVNMEVVPLDHTMEPLCTKVDSSMNYGNGHNQTQSIDVNTNQNNDYYSTHNTRDKQMRSVATNQELTPLPAILKQYLHAMFFRTPALAPRGIRILLQGLVRIHFERREDCIMEPDILPPMKTAYYSRPLSRAIIREVYRKLACYNVDDLIVSLYCMFPLRMFELELAPLMVGQLTEMWAHQLEDGMVHPDQRRLIRVFYETLSHNIPELYNGLDHNNLDTILRYCELAENGA